MMKLGTTDMEEAGILNAVFTSVFTGWIHAEESQVPEDRGKG